MYLTKYKIIVKLIYKYNIERMVLMENRKFKEIVLQGILDGYTDDLKLIKSEYSLETFSSRYPLARDLANSNIINSLDRDRYRFPKFKRGAHEFILIYDKKEKILYSTMQEKTFKTLKRSPNGNKIHYLEALGLINYDRNPLESQVMFFEDEYRMNNTKELLDKIVASDILDEVKVHNLISFNIKNNEMKSVRSIQLNSNLDIIAYESWNDYITVKFDDIGISNLDIEAIDYECVDEMDIEISIKGTNIQSVVK